MDFERSNINSNQPLVSIVTSSYNQGQFIEDTILSVKNQDYPNIEHVVIDACSTDNTLDVFRKYEGEYNLRWISEPDGGQADAINKGIKMAKGDIIGWLNSDDTYFTKDTITRVMQEFSKFPDVELVHGDRVIIDEANRLLKVQYSRDFDYSMFLRGYCFIYTQTVFLRRDFMAKYQLDSTLQLAMDVKLWLDIGRDCHSRYMNSFLGCFRLHSISKTASSSNVEGWNKEKQGLVSEYAGYLPRMRGHNISLNSILFRFKRVWAGSYKHYFSLPLDTVKIAFCYRDKFAFPIKITKVQVPWYIIRSIIPALKE